MAKFKNVFFSFHYADVMLASIIRKCDQFFTDRISFRDWADWESVRLRSDQAIMKWIDEQIKGARVTVVLIGGMTATRRWVHYEIAKSIERGNGILGIYLNHMRGPRHAGTGPKGSNPFALYLPRKASGTRRESNINALIDIGLDSKSLHLAPNSESINSAIGLKAPPLNSLGLLSPSPPSYSLGLLPSTSHIQNDGLLGFARPPRNSLWEMYGRGERAMTSQPLNLAAQVDCYCWEDQNGHYNIADWIERAARDVGR